MLIVHIGKPPTKSLGDWFSELRSWFDSNRCHPSQFVNSGSDRAVFAISFNADDEAHRFVNAFAAYGAAIAQSARSH